MNKASPIDMRKMLDVVDVLKRAGIMFVPVPILNDEDKAKYLELMNDQFEKAVTLTDGCDS
jgi:hypothetical protein